MGKHKAKQRIEDIINNSGFGLRRIIALNLLAVCESYMAGVDFGLLNEDMFVRWRNKDFNLLFLNQKGLNHYSKLLEHNACYRVYYDQLCSDFADQTIERYRRRLMSVLKKEPEKLEKYLEILP